MSEPDNCCADYLKVSRRGLLRGAAGVMGVAAVGSSFGGVFTQTAYGAAPGGNVLVLLSLRGAADGLSLVVPHADPAYYAARPRIAVPAASLLAKDASFGLHPCLAPLLPLWSAGKVAAVHATGLPVANRSHFAAMELVEGAAPGSRERSGWLNRLIGTDAIGNPLEAIQYGNPVPSTQITGPQPVLSTSGVDAVVLRRGISTTTSRRRSALEALWADRGGLEGAAAQRAFTAVDSFAPVLDQRSQVAGGVRGYQDGDLAKALRSTAQTIRANVGARVVTVDHGSWDMHTGVGNLGGGLMRQMAGELARNLAAFFVDLGPLADKVTVVTISEFGRRVAENANLGLDHGHGNVMFVLGAGVRGGYVARWPSLVNALDADLAVTTDYRDVLAEVVAARFPRASLASVFPGFTRRRVGVMVRQ